MLLLVGFKPTSACCQNARGQLQGGKPIGVWEYYDGKELGLRFDYDSSRINYIRPDTTQYFVLIDSTWQTRRLYRAPRVLGSTTDLIGAVQKQLRYPLQDLRAQVSGTVVLTYVIDEQGRKINPVATVAPSKTLAEEVYRAFETTTFFYLPAIYRGKRVATKIAFAVRFCLCKTPEDCQQAIQIQVRQTPKPLGSLGEVISVANLAR